MKCEKCQGVGYVDNQQYYKYSHVEAYERGLESTIRCRSCGGSGFKIGNYNEAIESMQVMLNNATDRFDRKTIKETLALLGVATDGTPLPPVDINESKSNN